MSVDEILPREVTQGATLRGKEYGWQISSFPKALVEAKSRGFACLGGQFQFRLDDGVCEMYWLSADSTERTQGEQWDAYCHRSCAQVLENFQKLILHSDFGKEAANWKLEIDPVRNLVFVAYFISEEDFDKRRYR